MLKKSCIIETGMMCTVWCYLFPLTEHWNYLGVDETLGPVAVSLRREKLDDHKDHGPQFNYRVIFRTSEVSAHYIFTECYLEHLLCIFQPMNS